LGTTTTSFPTPIYTADNCNKNSDRCTWKPHGLNNQDPDNPICLKNEYLGDTNLGTGIPGNGMQGSSMNPPISYSSMDGVTGYSQSPSSSTANIMEMGQQIMEHPTVQNSIQTGFQSIIRYLDNLYQNQLTNPNASSGTNFNLFPASSTNLVTAGSKSLSYPQPSYNTLNSIQLPEATTCGGHMPYPLGCLPTRTGIYN